MSLRLIALALVLSIFLPAAAFGATVPLTKSNVICSATASSKLVKAGEKVTVSWTGRSIVALGPSGTKIPPFGSMIVTPTETTIYKFKFLGIGGNKKCGVRVRVIGDEVPA